jgi:hypothetical protein
MVQITQHRIILQQVRQRFGISYVIDCDEVDVLVAERRTEDVSADATKPINANFHRHALSPCRFRFLSNGLRPLSSFNMLTSKPLVGGQTLW